MKGLTQILRNLAVGEQAHVSDTERSDIHKIAKRLSIPVKIEKVYGGFDVTRIAAPVTPQMRFATSVENAENGKFIEIQDGGQELWKFTKDRPEFHDSGRVYRQQYLVSNPKQRRTVRVDDEDHEQII